jgi:hypothetical protein
MLSASWHYGGKKSISLLLVVVQSIVLFLIAAYLYALEEREVELIERETRERHALLSAEEWHYYLYLTRAALLQ